MTNLTVIVTTKMKLLALVSFLICCSLYIAGCGNDDETEEGNIFLTDENNYSFTGDLNIPTLTTACGEDAVDIVIDWSELTTDLQYHEMDPANDIDNVMLVRIQDLTQAQVQQELSTSELSAEFLDGYLAVLNEDHGTTAAMADMTLMGSPPPDGVQAEYIDDDRVYLLLLASGTTPGVGARMLTFLDPDDNSSNTEINISHSPILDFSADLTSLTSVPIPADGPWVVDWSGLEHDGQGNDIVYENIDGVMLGFYENETLESLQDQVLDLKLITPDIWEMDFLGGRTVNLTDFEGFEGLTGEGTWIFGLTCSMCQNPAPLFLTALEVE